MFSDPSGADGLPPEPINTWHYAGGNQMNTGAGNLSAGDHMFGQSGDDFWNGQTNWTGGDLAWEKYSNDIRKSTVSVENLIQVANYIEKYDQDGKEVTKESLGIKKGDTAEIMVGKMMKGMRNGDFISGDEMNFLSDSIGDLVRYAYKSSDTTFRIERTTLAGRAALNSQATLTISKGNFQLTKQTITGYNYKISGFRVDMSGKIATFGLISGNHSYYNNVEGKPRRVKIF